MSLKYDNINVFSYVHAAFCTLGNIHYQCSLIPLMFRSRLWWSFGHTEYILFGLDQVDKYPVDIYCSFHSQYSTSQLSSLLLKQ